MPKLNVTLLLDRAGLVGEDGATHHGVWDLASMLPVPNMVILAPRDLNELRVMMRWTQENESPCAIRYGRESVDLSARYPAQDKPFRIGEWEMMEQGGDVALLAVGSMVAEAIEVRDLLEKRGIHAALVNCRPAICRQVRKDRHDGRACADGRLRQRGLRVPVRRRAARADAVLRHPGYLRAAWAA